MLFYGYKLKGKTIKDIQFELKPIREKIQKIADESYHALVGKEAAFLGDCMTLNIMERDVDQNYIQNACELVDFWIRKFNMNRIYGKYNFSIYGYLFEFKNHTYIRVEFKNPIFKEAFSSMEAVSVDRLGYESSDFWKYVTNSIKEEEPVSVNLSPTLDFKMSKLIFPQKADRVSEWARHQELNRIMDSLRYDQNPIPGERLMSHVDFAFQTYLDKEKEDAETSQKNADRQALNNLLLDFNEEENRNLLKERKENENTEDNIS